MKMKLASCGILLGAMLLFPACKGVVTKGGGDNLLGGNGGVGGNGGAGGQGGATTSAVTVTVTTTSANGGAGGAGGCQSGPNDDSDNDGFTPATGDCNDCDAAVNPDAIEAQTLPGETPRDENCDGQIDEPIPACDGNLAIDDPLAANAAKAIDICKVSSGPSDWGLVDASWVLADGAPAPAVPEYDLGHGILDNFGPNVAVRHGDSLLALSTGTARRPLDAGYVDTNYPKNYQSGQPAGFPKEAPACPGVTTGQANDAAALQVTLRAPSNATGLAFDFTFYTHEFPVWVCTPFNDLFVAMLAPIPAGQTDGNISFDSQGNPVSVNNVFLEACGCQNGPPCQAGGKTYACGLGTGPLLDTGFGVSQFSQDGNGATGWLTTSSPVTAGETIQLRFAILDSSDGILDSTVLTDNFRWITQGQPIVQTVRAPAAAE